MLRGAPTGVSHSLLTTPFTDRRLVVEIFVGRILSPLLPNSHCPSRAEGSV